MNNCSVTKLKASVNDPDLEKFGVLVLTTHDGEYSSFQLSLEATEGKTVVLSSDGLNFKRYSGGTNPWVDNFTVGDEAVSFVLANEKTFEIKDKYNLRKIYVYYKNVDSVDISNYKYITTLEHIQGSHKGDLSNFINLVNLKVVDISGGLTGNIANLRKATNLSSLKIPKCPNIEGEVCFIGTCTSLTEFKFREAKINGSIEDFVAAQRGAMRTSCEGMSFDGFGTTVTFNGSSVAANHAVTLSWTANTITYNGTEISNSDVITPTELEEIIAEWGSM